MHLKRAIKQLRSCRCWLVAVAVTLLQFLDTSSASISAIMNPPRFIYKPSWANLVPKSLNQSTTTTTTGESKLTDDSALSTLTSSPSKSIAEEDPYYFLNKDLYHPDSYLKKPHPYFGIMRPLRRPIAAVMNPYHHRAFGIISNGKESVNDLKLSRPYPAASINLKQGQNIKLQSHLNILNKNDEIREVKRKGC